MRWLSSYDTDEFFVPLQHHSLQGALQVLEDKGTIAEVTGSQKVVTCLNLKFTSDVPGMGRCVFDSERPIDSWDRRWCCSKYWARADMTLFAGLHVAFTFTDTTEKACRRLDCPRRFVSMSDGEASKDKDKVLLEYLHYKHYDQDYCRLFQLKLFLDTKLTLLFHMLVLLFLLYICMDQ